jgi:hypothetical protein
MSAADDGSVSVVERLAVSSKLTSGPSDSAPETEQHLEIPTYSCPKPLAEFWVKSRVSLAESSVAAGSEWQLSELLAVPEAKACRSMNSASGVLGAEELEPVAQVTS